MESPTTERQRRITLEGLQILVVDDDEDMLDLLVVMLKARGANVTAASSAREALDRFKERRFDLLLSDIGMPGMDGYSLIRAIRSLSEAEGGKTPAIAVTAYGRTEDRERALAAGFQRHVSKPLDPLSLVNTLLELVSG